MRDSKQDDGKSTISDYSIQFAFPLSYRIIVRTRVPILGIGWRRETMASLRSCVIPRAEVSGVIGD